MRYVSRVPQRKPSTVMTATHFSLVAFIVGGLCSASPGADYLKDIKPILKERCFACHGALKQESDLRVDTAAAMKTGGASGPAVVGAHPEQSLILERLQSKDPFERMPPEGQPLSETEIAHIREWILAGALAPEGEAPEKDPNQHWAFQPPVRAPLPQRFAGQSPIDAFILQQLETSGIEPAGEVSKSQLLRRVYLDLIGLPPLPEEYAAFLQDDSEQAYENVVEKLLADPRYGERWGRHWMDVWRYSDWYGRRHVPDVWNSAPQIWRWRDWIVRSLNEDKGYDRMVTEMLAGDEVQSGDQSATVATGYLIRNWFALNPNDWMRNNVEHTGKAFLGLTFNCAHCHDHKYDPISQQDYFQFRAFFEPIGIRQDRVPDESDPGPFQEYDYSSLRKVQRLGAVAIYDKNPEAPTWFYTGGDERNRKEDLGSIPPGVPGFLNQDQELAVEVVELPDQGWYPGLDPEIRRTLLEQSEQRLMTAQQDMLSEEEAPPSKVEQHVLDRLAEAQQAYDAAEEELGSSASGQALSGQSSLVLNATSGRRMIFHRLESLKDFGNGFTIDFQLLLTNPSHFNFQLAKDLDKGLTAGYVGFENGKVFSYKPGSFQEFEVGELPKSEQPIRLDVHLELQTEKDEALLTVRSHPEMVSIVEALPVAMNGWNPVGDSAKGILFDARPGALAVVDDVILRSPLSAEEATRNGVNSSLPIVAQFNFEAPEFQTEVDIAGQVGWEVASYSNGGATSLLAANWDSGKQDRLRQNLKIAQWAAEPGPLKRHRALAAKAAAEKELLSLKARISADDARFGNAPEMQVRELAIAAQQLEREAAFAASQAKVADAELAVAVAAAVASDAKDQQKNLNAATNSLQTANAELAKARQLLKATADENYTPLSQLFPQQSTGRRTALARWMTDRQNPLAARVAVNHIWMRHFHSPLVETVFNFGRSGEAPSHPELLDWLAVELMESGWSMKHLHQLIVTSRAYRRSSQSGDYPAQVAVDPENQLLWRTNPGRMESEVVRDSLLYLAGKLDPLQGGQELENSEAFTTFRRTLYYSVHPENGGKNQQGELFDAPSGQECYRRTRSIIPQQALALTNSDFVHSLSSKIVKDWELQLKSESIPPTDSETHRFVTEMFHLILVRDPTETELAICQQAMTTYRDLSEAADDIQRETQARESLVRVLFNHNDFITIR